MMNGSCVHTQYMISGKCDLFSINHTCSSTEKLPTDLQGSLGFKKERRHNQLKSDVKASGRLSRDCSETRRVAYV